jgi:superfamily II DNA or RNA helicase/HKD family nuclease
MVKLADGLYDLLITREVERKLSQLESSRRFDPDDLEPADAHLVLARHIAAVIREALRDVPDAEKPGKQAAITNEILRAAAEWLPKQIGEDDYLAEPPKRLAAIYSIDGLKQQRPVSPAIPLSQSDLLVNARGEPRIGAVLEKEIESADRIDLIVAFIRWSGLRLVAPKLRAFVERGGVLRVITSTYTGSTERRAIEHLIELGSQVKVSYHTDTTRLHAKAWFFHRNSGFSTVFIGSSNLSTSAMVDGVEWNVRLTQSDAPTIVAKFAATFEGYWADADYELYDPARDAERFDTAVRRASDADDRTISFARLDVEPWPHQREMLEELNVERYRHNRWRNLVVAATGTGKTVVAALDYRRLSDRDEPLPWSVKQRPLSLLFVAHRREILTQSIGTFRAVLRDGSFGELYVDGKKPDQWTHVFASVQSLSTVDLDRVPAEHFDVVIVDEFHHAAAPTYRKLLDHLRPKVLLGLTATPERTDGEPILEWFGGKIAVELRLWDALDRGLLSPFHYFGVHDSVDLSKIAWKRGRYDERELENVYTANDARVAQVLQQLKEKVGDIAQMRALGFCIGVHHAKFMAERFRRAGIPAAAVIGTTDSDVRDEALRKLRDREINCLFAVDIFNEGVDVPQIDTVLFLRPTESALVFLQQLGRGLRRWRDKNCLTVLDFIGNAHRNFRFDLRYRALTGASRREVEQQVENGFPYLPAGCAIQLDREASRIVLENLRQSIGSNRFANLVAELRNMPRDTTLARFLHDSVLDPEDLYRSKDWSWTRLRREAGHAETAVSRIADAALTNVESDEPKILNAFPRLLHMDDERRLDLLRRILSASSPPSRDALTIFDRRVLEGFLLTLWADEERDFDRALQRLWSQAAARAELLELINVLDDRAAHRTFPIADELPTFRDVPLSLHARYTRDELLAAIGRSTLAAPFTHREGPLWHEPTNTD